MQDVIYNFYMATYWIQEGADLAYHGAKKEDDVVQGGEKLFPSTPPELKTDKERINYLFQECAYMANSILRFLDEAQLKDIPNMWLLNAVTRITEARYSIMIADIQYERLQNTGGPSLLNH